MCGAPVLSPTTRARWPEGWITAGYKDGAIKVWDAGYHKRQLNPAHPLASHTLSACLAGTLELKTQKENAHSELITSVAFSPDGCRIATTDVQAHYERVRRRFESSCYEREHLRTRCVDQTPEET